VSKLTAQDLAQFTGTTCYYRMGTQHLLTEGTHYLAEKAGCYWIIDAATSHLKEIDTSDWFFAVRMNVTHQRAMIRYLDGNGRELVSQKIATQTSRSQTSRSQTSRSRPPGTASIGSSCCTVSIEHELSW